MSDRARLMLQNNRECFTICYDHEGFHVAYITACLTVAKVMFALEGGCSH